jgi:hypothetical protein
MPAFIGSKFNIQGQGIAWLNRAFEPERYQYLQSSKQSLSSGTTFKVIKSQ